MVVYFGMSEVRAPEKRDGRAGSSSPAGTAAGSDPGACDRITTGVCSSYPASSYTTGCSPASSASPGIRTCRTAGGTAEGKRAERTYSLYREGSVSSERCPNRGKAESAAGDELYEGEGL